MSSRVEKSKRPAKADGALKAKKSAPKTVSESTPTKSGSTNDLRDVINALGGGDEDYELVKDLDSEDLEEFSDHEDDAKTTKDIAQFLKKLNFKAQDAVVLESDSSPDEKADEKLTKATTKPVKPATDTTVPPAEANAVKKQLAAAKLNIPASSRWYAVDFPPLRPIPTLAAPSKGELASLRAKGEALHAALPPPPSTSKSDEQFIANVLASGTLSDRLSALTLMAQASPIHNTRALESLRTMASKKGREESLKALRAIVDWWVGGGGPDRKLRYFADQPVNHPDATDAMLTLWFFEDWLKKYFFNVLQLLETLSQDLLPYVRTQAMTLLFQLLDGKPEQEQNLLRLLVNKLGDSEKNVASKASYQLLQLLQHHPGMKGIITREISSLVFRPPAKTASASTTADGANLHARYYSVITLNQMTLAANDQAVAGLLVDLYFKLFREILHEGAKNEKKPAPKRDILDDDEASAEKGKGVKRGRDGRERRPRGPVKGKGKAPEIPTDGFTEVEDSDSRTISAILSGVNRAMPFAKPDDAMFDDHIDTLFRITHTATFNVSVQALMLILQVTSSKKTVSDRFYRTLYESILDQRLINSSKQAMWLNLMFKAVKADESHERICAFVKRTLQSLGMHQPPFICGALYMLGQLMDTTPGLRDMLNKPVPAAKKTSTGTKRTKETDAPVEHDETYDPRKREPQYAHAEKTCLWEMIPLLNHFHPSVSLHARQILTNVQVTATPDLALNTLSHFLDRFVYKNPKKPKPRGASAMQPAAAAQDASGSVRLIRGGVSGLNSTGTVNEEGFWKQRPADVPVDQLFFHKFFLNKLDKQKEKNKKLAKRKKGGDDSDSESGESSDAASEDANSDDDIVAGGDGDDKGADVDSDEENSDDPDEAEIWRVMQETMPGPKADLDLMEDSDDSDSIPSGLDDMSDSDAEEEEGSGVEEDDLDADSAPDDDEDADELDEIVNDDDDNNDDDSSDAVDFAEDEDDLIDFDADDFDDQLIPSAFEPEDSEAVTGKRKPAEEDTQKGGRKKRKLGALPTFASYEDYAKLIEGAPEEDI